MLKLILPILLLWSCTNNISRVIYNDRIVISLRLPFHNDDRFILPGVESNAWRVTEYCVLKNISVERDSSKIALPSSNVFLSLHESQGIRRTSERRLIDFRTGRGGAFLDTAIVLMKNSWVWARCDSLDGSADVVSIHLGVDIPRETSELKK